jgi:hypothetical protein
MARLVVEEHPSLPDSVTLEVLPQEVEAFIPEEANYVRATYYPASASGGVPSTFVLSVEEFNNLSPTEDMETVLIEALRSQQGEEGRRRGRQRRRQAGQRRPRVDYTDPMHAGEPHRGRITDAEKEYFRNNLSEVNERLVRDGLRTIDPSDPEMAERYGLTSRQTDAVEEQLEEETGL